MQTVSEVRDLHLVARKRIDYLESMVPNILVRPSRALDKDISFVVIELLNCWANFSRALYFSSCRGARDGMGNKIVTTLPLGSLDDALDQAVWRFKPSVAGLPGPWTHREEPNWLDPNTLLILLQLVGASNSGDVSAALSFQTRALVDLPSLRNFYAHRTKNTAEKVRRMAITYSLPSIHHPAELCLGYAPGRPQSILADWVSELRLITDLATS